jgi:hypothetical protein
MKEEEAEGPLSCNAFGLDDAFLPAQRPAPIGIGSGQGHDGSSAGAAANVNELEIDPVFGEQSAFLADPVIAS